MASATYVNGRQSKHLPSRLAGFYNEAQSDSELISVRDEIRLVDAMVNEALSRLDTKEAEAHWAQLDRLVEQISRADETRRLAALEALKTWSIGALSDFAVKSEVLDLIERRRKLAETESKRLSAMGQMITSERAMILLAHVVDICRRNVSNRNELSAIAREIGQLADLRPKE